MTRSADSSIIVRNAREHNLRGIDLEIRAGELTSILGASGAGKTTLLQILGTLDGPDSGTLRVAGAEVTRLRSAALSGWLARALSC